MRTVAFRQVHGAHRLAQSATAYSRAVDGRLQHPLRRLRLAAVAAAAAGAAGTSGGVGPFFRIFDCDYLQAVYCGRQSFGDALNSFLISAGLSPGQAEEAGRALESHRRQSEASHRPLIGVRETLAQLDHSGIKLGVLCNSEHAGETIQRQLTEVLGSSPWSAVVSSRDLGSAMPQAECYAAALDAIRLPAAAAAFVGHDARELHGAFASGAHDDFLQRRPRCAGRCPLAAIRGPARFGPFCPVRCRCGLNAGLNRTCRIPLTPWAALGIIRCFSVARDQ